MKDELLNVWLITKTIFVSCENEKKKKIIQQF